METRKGFAAATLTPVKLWGATSLYGPWSVISIIIM